MVVIGVILPQLEGKRGSMKNEQNLKKRLPINNGKPFGNVPENNQNGLLPSLNLKNRIRFDGLPHFGR